MSYKLFIHKTKFETFSFFVQVINDIRDLNEAYQYFNKKYKEKWRKKIEMEEEDEGKDDKENVT